MLTREEQITKLEEVFNAVVLKLAAAHANNWNDAARKNAKQLIGITAALTYLRTVIPNPRGKIDPVGPRRKINLREVL